MEKTNCKRDKVNDAISIITWNGENRQEMKKG